MCYAKPGPRCSAHVKVELDIIQKEWEESPSDEGFSALKEKELEYDTTPAGQADLQKRITEKQDTDGVLAARLEQGKFNRQRALDLMKKSTGGLLPLHRVRRGLNDPNDPGSREILDNLNKDAKAFQSSLTEDEVDATYSYALFGNEILNAPLMGKKSKERIQKENPRLFNEDGEFSDSFHELRNKIKVPLDDAFKKTKPSEEPRILYRSHIVHDGDTEGYLAQFKEGKTFTFNGYTSTSVDSDLMVYQGSLKGGRRGQLSPKKRVVFEIVSRNGIVLHDPETEEDTNAWSVQSDEKEVLLPPGSKMKVVGVKDGVSYQSTRTSEDGSGRPWGQGFYRTGARAKFAVVQVVEVEVEDDQ